MSDNNDVTTVVERVLQSINSIVTTVAFLGMIWLAVHILTNPDGARDVHRYILSHYSNWVDPEIVVSVSNDGSGRFLYAYAVSNGPFAIQSIKQFTICTRSGRPISEGTNWVSSFPYLEFSRQGVMWDATHSRDRSEIKRGEVRSGFVLSSMSLPSVVEAHAGHSLSYRFWRGVLTDARTPAGERVVRWTLGPADLETKDAVPTDVLKRLVSDIRKATRLGWISDPELGDAVVSSLQLAEQKIETGDHPYATALLERLIAVVRANEGLALSNDAAVLIVMNCEWLLHRISTMPIK